MLFQKNNMIPLPSMVFTGDGRYEETGFEFKWHLIHLAQLKPTHKLLDVGSGIGRIAAPLTSYLTTEGEYFGIEIVKSGVKWCTRKISGQFSNFRFIHADAYNKLYNPTGAVPSEEYKFPFSDNFFDVVFLSSVFTHMRPPEVENYVREISRVLKPSGRCLVTAFLLNKESRQSTGELNFAFEMDGFFTANKHMPEGAVAFNESYILGLFRKSSLEILPPIHRGSWCGRSDYLSFQDIVVARKS